jgi:hypothetical protein
VTCSYQFHVKIELPSLKVESPAPLIEQVKQYYEALHNHKVPKFNNQGEILACLLKNHKGSILPYISVINKQMKYGQREIIARHFATSPPADKGLLFFYAEYLFGTTHLKSD